MMIFYRIWKNIDASRKKVLFFLVILMILASFAEVLSIGMLFPFLGAITDPEAVYQYESIQILADFLQIKSSEQLLFPLTLIFSLSVILAGVIRILLLYVTTRITSLIGSDFSYKAYKATLYQEYSTHMDRNSSKVIDVLVNKITTVVHQVLIPLLTILSSIILFIGILTILFIIDPYITTILLFSFGFIYALIIKLTKKLLKDNSKSISYNSNLSIKSVQEGLGGIRDVLIDGSQDFHCTDFQNVDLPMRRAQGENQFISGAPRFLVESLGMVVIAFIAFFMIDHEKGISTTIAFLGVIAIGAQRLMPILQQSYFAFASISGSKDSLIDVLSLLEQPLPNHLLNTSSNQYEVLFNEEITVNNVGFSYCNDAYVFQNINLSINKGDCIGFVGITGSGKSTLVDIIMGLLSPVDGNIAVDGVCLTVDNCHLWRKKISHVPQHIYLSDGSVAENIALGVNARDVNHCRIKDAANAANIVNFIESLKDGYETIIGENGAKLSGGQRQRIGIARALYKGSDILVLDEATSALDINTEADLMNSINKLSNITIIIIAHRLSTLSMCNKVYELDKSLLNDVTERVQSNSRL